MGRQYLYGQINTLERRISEHYETIGQLRDLLQRQTDELSWFRGKKAVAESEINARQTALNHISELKQVNSVAGRYHSLMSVAMNNERNYEMSNTFQDMVSTMEEKIEETRDKISQQYQYISGLESEIESLWNEIYSLENEEE